MVNTVEEHRFVTNGKHGNNGSYGLYGGAHGSHGFDGENARWIDLTLIPLPDTNLIKITNQGKDFFAPLGNPKASIFLEAKGGNGGNGGKGAPGISGQRGTSGYDATKYSSGTDGGPGEDGGPGGNGGDGGRGGNGGIVSINVNKADTDLLMLLNVPNVSAGKGGEGGNGGWGGEGGSGGSGGSSYSSTSDNHHHHNCGGSRGSDGERGRKGCAGMDGDDGKNGKFEINVIHDQDVMIYSSPYNIEIVHAELSDSNQDGIYEPGEKIKCEITMQNTGGMPTPETGIQFSIPSTTFLQSVSSELLTETLPASEKLQLHAPLKTTLNAPRSPTQNSPYRKNITIKFRAQVERIQKCFLLLNSVSPKIETRYPVFISPIKMAPSITLEEEAPFAFYIENVSTKAFGKETNSARFLQIVLKKTEGGRIKDKDLIYRNREGTILPFIEGISTELGELKPHEKKVFSGTFSFAQSCIASFEERAKVTCNLVISPINNSATTKTIQQNHHELQLSRFYQRSSTPKGDDLLLVTNARTTMAEIDHWKNLAKCIGIRDVALWNLSLYGGLDLQRAKTDGTSLLNDFTGKTVVILNHKLENGEYAVQSVCLKTIHRAAQTAKIKTLFIGRSSFDFSTIVIPSGSRMTKPLFNFKDLLQVLEDDERVLIEYFVMEIKGTFFFTEPKLDDLKEQANKILEKLKERFPERVFLVVYDFNPEPIGAVTYKLGTIEIHPSLLKSETSLAWVQLEGEMQLEEDKIKTRYHLLKLLPFTNKLELLQNHVEANEDNILGLSMLSDLMDEQLTFGSKDPFESFSKQEIADRLIKLNLLCKYETKSPLEEKFLGHLLLRMKYAIKRVGSIFDKFLFSNRRLATTISLELINKRLASMNRDRVKATYHYIQQKYKRYTPDKLVKEFVQPEKFCDKVLYDNHIPNECISKKAYTRRKLDYLRPRIVEGRYLFKNEEERLRAIKAVEAELNAPI